MPSDLKGPRNPGANLSSADAHVETNAPSLKMHVKYPTRSDLISLKRHTMCDWLTLELLLPLRLAASEVQASSISSTLNSIFTILFYLPEDVSFPHFLLIPKRQTYPLSRTECLHFSPQHPPNYHYLRLFGPR